VTKSWSAATDRHRRELVGWDSESVSKVRQDRRRLGKHARCGAGERQPTGHYGPPSGVGAHPIRRPREVLNHRRRRCGGCKCLRLRRRTLVTLPRPSHPSSQKRPGSGQRPRKLLCGPGRYFLCRHCCGVVYTSQSEGLMDRSIRRANKIRARLGGDSGMASPFPARPKGMWARTYEHLRQQALDSEIRADQAMAQHTARLLAGTDKPKETGSFWA
jgi:hypothetical protein